jgi:hypothetical protein
MCAVQDGLVRELLGRGVRYAGGCAVVYGAVLEPARKIPRAGVGGCEKGVQRAVAIPAPHSSSTHHCPCPHARAGILVRGRPVLRSQQRADAVLQVQGTSGGHSQAQATHRPQSTRSNVDDHDQKPRRRRCSWRAGQAGQSSCVPARLGSQCLPVLPVFARPSVPSMHPVTLT